MSYISGLKMRKAASALRERCTATLALIDAMERAWDDSEALEEDANALERRRHAGEICHRRPIEHLPFRRRRCANWDILELAAKRFMVAAQMLESLTGPLEALYRMCSVKDFDELPRPANSDRYNPHDSHDDTNGMGTIAATAEEIEFHARVGRAMAEGVDWESWPEVIARKNRA